MDTKTLLLATISIFAVAPEIIGAATKDICVYPPIIGFPGSQLQKWGYFPDTNECKLFTWGGVDGNGNHFNTEKECMDACRSAQPPKPVKKYNIVPGQCVCRCPRCDVDFALKVAANPIVATTTSVESPAKATEKPVQSIEKLITSTEALTTEPTESKSTTPNLETTNSPKSWFSRLFSL